MEEIERKSLYQILKENLSVIIVIIVSFVLLIFGNVSKGSEFEKSAFFEQCSYLSFFVFFTCMIGTNYFGSV